MRAWVGIAVVCCGCGRFGFGSLPADGGADSRTDSGGDSGDAPAPSCQGTAHLITDNFDDNAFDGALWGGSYEDSSSRHVETGGRLEIQIGANDANDWAGYATSTLYELKDDRMLDVGKPDQALAVAAQHRIRRHHLGVQARMPRQQAMEDTAVPVRPLHHRRNGK